MKEQGQKWRTIEGLLVGDGAVLQDDTVNISETDNVTAWAVGA